MRVLVIDDEPDVLLLCRVNLEFAGHEVLEAANGEDGLEIARVQRPEVIVLDVMLPRKDGFTILEELRDDPRTSQIPVVMLTAKTQSADRVHGFRAGAVEYVTKPFSPTALCATIEQIAGWSPQERVQHQRAALRSLAANGA